MRPERKIIHIDVDPTSISKRVAVHIPIVGDCAQAIDLLLAHLEPHPLAAGRHAPWLAQIEAWRALRCLDYQRSDRIKPQHVIELLSRMPRAEDFIVTPPCQTSGRCQGSCRKKFDVQAASFSG